MGEVVPARTSPTLHPPSPPTVHQLSRLALQELINTVCLEGFHLNTCIIGEREGQITTVRWGGESLHNPNMANNVTGPDHMVMFPRL